MARLSPPVPSLQTASRRSIGSLESSCATSVLRRTESITALRVLPEYADRIPALQSLMGAPALFSRLTVPLRVELIQLLHEPSKRQLAIAVLRPLLHGHGLHAGREMRYAQG